MIRVKLHVCLRRPGFLYTDGHQTIEHSVLPAMNFRAEFGSHPES